MASRELPGACGPNWCFPFGSLFAIRRSQRGRMYIGRPHSSQGHHRRRDAEANPLPGWAWASARYVQPSRTSGAGAPWLRVYRSTATNSSTSAPSAAVSRREIRTPGIPPGKPLLPRPAPARRRRWWAGPGNSETLPGPIISMRPDSRPPPPRFDGGGMVGPFAPSTGPSPKRHADSLVVLSRHLGHTVPVQHSRAQTRSRATSAPSTLPPITHAFDPKN